MSDSFSSFSSFSLFLRGPGGVAVPVRNVFAEVHILKLDRFDASICLLDRFFKSTRNCCSREHSTASSDKFSVVAPCSGMEYYGVWQGVS